MAEETEAQENGKDGGAAEAVAEKGERVKEAFPTDGTAGKMAIGAVIAGATVAAGYAATKAAPKLKQSLSGKAGDVAGDMADDAASKAESKGGAAGFAAKLARKGGGDGDNGGGLSGMAKGLLPGSGGKDDAPSEGWGKGRRNPIQRWCDVGVPVDVAYAQWTQFEEFPNFMHRVVNVDHDEEERQKVKWQEKIWFSTRDWEAEIIEQIPNERIAWKTVSGTKHTGVVTFHKLDDNLTRILVNLDFQPSGLIEKTASGFRFVKRAVESDLCRFKAFIETKKEPTGAWLGRIEDGEVVDDPGVEEGEPIEEGAEARRPEDRSEEKEQQEDDGDEQPRAESDGSDDESEERQEEREERARRREERQTAGTSS
jgi:hypothetical protein